MRFISVCSGIEAASVAAKPLGWRAVAFSEIEPFPCALLAHHYPDTPNWGDMTKFNEWPDVSIDLLCGGTPCQSFSVAGLRNGLSDPRGNLMLTFGAIAAKYRPQWLVWENVPGVLSSNGGRDFGAFLGMLGQLGYGFAYRVLDAQYFGVAQRRRRVFVVGCLGDWRSAAAVLFERHSLQGHPAPSRKAREVAPTIPSRSTAGGGLGTDLDCDGGVICMAHGQGGAEISGERRTTLTCNHEAPIVAGTLGANHGNIKAEHEWTGQLVQQPVAFDTTQVTSAANYSNPKSGDPCHPLAAQAHVPAVAFGWQNSAAQGISASDEITPTLDKSKTPGLMHGAAVRRLTPEECEALQGFPRGYTAVPHRGKPAADGPRYKALGNSWAVPNVRWIFQRIDLVSNIKQMSEAA